MKRILSIVILVCILLSFAGCGKKAYKAKDVTFSADGISITLTKAFAKKQHEGYAAYYESSDVAVFVIKETFEQKGNFKDLSLEEYANLVYNSNSERNPTDITHNDGLTYMEYEFKNESDGETFRYFAVMYKGTDAFWLIQFACAVDSYNEYLPHFKNWAKTVTFSAATEGSDGPHEQVVLK